MSMLSSQIDELRMWADQLSERENEFGVVVRALVVALRDAADTIWQLRDDLQQANAEKAALERRIDELCAEVEALKREKPRTIPSVTARHVAKLQAENIKLREFAAKAWSLFIRHGAVHACDLSEVDAVRDGLRELGVID